jgi:hypothetical protein
MADDSSTTIWATFDTREAAELAVEHLVQLRGISRPDLFIQSATTENTAGSASSGSDASHDGEARTDAALEGEIVISADVAVVQRNHGDAGAIRILGR